MHINELSTDILAQHCAEETHNYIRNRPNDPRYCFELMRRALGEEDSSSLTHLYLNYMPLVIQWVRKQPGLENTGESVDFFASLAMSNFYLSLRGDKFVAKFASLARALSYLKSCARSVVLQDLRKQPPGVLVTIGDDIPLVKPNRENLISPEELWEHVARIIPDPADQLLLRCRFVWDMKPAEIADAHPSYWATAREVSVALQRIMRKLRRDPDLRQLATGESPAPDGENQ